MTIYALVSENSSIHLWGLSSAERLQRQLKQLSKETPAGLADIRWVDKQDDVPGGANVLLLNGAFLFEVRTLRGVLSRPNTVLLHDDHRPAAAFVSTRRLPEMMAAMSGTNVSLPKDLATTHTLDMEAFDENLRRSTRPLLEAIDEKRKIDLENQLYGNAYRGITDLVTKFVWPRPAKKMVHLCANLCISPNMVTSIGLLLVIAACFLFRDGYYVWGLLAGWVMTFLDTVDGKLARVTIQSSKFGHFFDHLIDLIHPPFWYIFWGMSLTGLHAVMGMDMSQAYWLIVIGYIAGRAVEGLFPLLGECSIFTWRPFDAWFRLVTARRNPCMILLTLSVLLGRPDWGFVAVVFWTALTTVILVLRLVQASFARLSSGPLSSWLSEPDVANGPHAWSYAIFGSTRSAYARGR